MEPEAVKKTLDKDEREIEKSASSYRPVSKTKLRRIESILGKVRKARNINIRISEDVLLELKRRSLEEGIPYQTLISSVLHKFVTNRLVDEKAIRRSMELLSRKHHKAEA
jgi:predicted DNA binding CopG/RHH family protein